MTPTRKKSRAETAASIIKRPSRLSSSLTNGQVAELLALEAEKAQGHLRKAYSRASRSAFLWPVSACDVLAEGGSLTALNGIGPFLAKTIQEWIRTNVSVPEPPEIRRDFLTLAELLPQLKARPGWRGNLKGDLQMHSTWSDGSGSIAEMAEAGIARGYEYISITDHTKGLKIAGGISEDDLQQQRLEIEAVNSALAQRSARFEVLRSAELNLNPQGAGDMDSASLATLDLVLGSFHSALRKTEDQTSRYLAALRNPDIQILGHPRGRIYNYRLGLSADWRRVFALAAELDKAVEIDAYPDRQDLNVDLLKIAREEGTRISFGSDAHAPEQLIFLDLALGAALMARIPEDRIINFMPASDLRHWVQNVRERGGQSSPHRRD